MNQAYTFVWRYGGEAREYKLGPRGQILDSWALEAQPGDDPSGFWSADSADVVD